MTARHLTITGRVQGVGFRAWTRDQAARLGVAGWVRNRDDGSVEARLEGPEAALEEMVRAIGDGPGGARVEAVEAEVVEPEGARDFVLRR